VLKVEALKTLTVITVPWVHLLVQVSLESAISKLATPVPQLLDRILPISLTKPTQELIAISLNPKDIIMDGMPLLQVD